MEPLARPKLSQSIPAWFRTEVATFAEEVAEDTEGRAANLDADTIGKIYSNLLSNRLSALARRQPELKADDEKKPKLYMIGGVTIIHYSVLQRSGGFSTHPGKQRIAEYLKETKQQTFSELDDTFQPYVPVTSFCDRLSGPLCVLGTRISKTLGDNPQMRLTHTFLGYPAFMSNDLAVTHWHPGVLDLFGDTVAEPPAADSDDVTAEDLGRIEYLRLRPGAIEELEDDDDDDSDLD